MDDKKIECAIAHFDKKVTDYQMHVDKVLQEQANKIKTLTNFITNIRDNLSEYFNLEE